MARCQLQVHQPSADYLTNPKGTRKAFEPDHEMIEPGTPVPFATDNEALALALHTCGETMLDCVNLYTREILDRLGFPEGTAREAFKKGFRGRVTFYFEKSERLESLIEAWKSAKTDHDNGKDMSLAECTPEEFMQAACYLQQKRKAFGDVWKRKSPKVFEFTGEPLKTKDGDGYRIDIPAFKIRSIDRKSES